MAKLTIGVITNPNSRKNRGRIQRARRLEGVVGSRGLVRQTDSVDEIGEVLDEFRSSGIRYWVTDGGDGSLHWMLNIARQRFGGTDHVPLAVPTNGGTIDFVARYAGVEGDALDILRRLVRLETSGREPPTVEVPTLLVRGLLEEDGELRPFERMGFASAVSGIGAGFFDHYYDGTSTGSRAIVEVLSKGAVSFLVDKGPWRRAVPKSWLAFGDRLRGRTPARVSLDGEELPFRDLTVFNVGAFPINLGGVLRVFNQAGGGRLQIMVGDVGDLSLMRNLPRLMTNRSPRSKNFRYAAIHEVHAVATEQPFRPVVDGEVLGDVRELTITPGRTVAVPRIKAKR